MRHPEVATNARETLSSILGLAVEMGMIPVNPAGFRYQYPDPGSHPGDFYGQWLSTFDEQRRLLSYVHERFAGEAEERIVVLGLCQGLRKGEVFGLDGEDIDLGAGELSVLRSYTVGASGPELTAPKTPAAVRVMPIGSFALSCMRGWGLGEGPVVTDRFGKRMGPAAGSKRIRRMIERADADLPRATVFSLRHSFATARVNAGMEKTQLAALMGHRDLRTTEQYYVRQKISDLHRAVREIDAALDLDAE